MIDSLDDFLRELRGQPGKLEELRRLLGNGQQNRVAEQLAALSAEVRELASAQRHSDEQLGALSVEVKELAEAQKRTERKVEELAEAQKRTERKVEELAEAQERTEKVVQELCRGQEALRRDQKELRDHVAGLRGDTLERRYRERAHAYFGRLVRRAHALGPNELHDLLEPAIASGALDEDQAHHVRLADVIVHGRRDGKELFVVLEASCVIDVGDVERAHERATLLGRAGVSTLGAVGGERIEPGAEHRARVLGIKTLLDGKLSA